MSALRRTALQCVAAWALASAPSATIGQADLVLIDVVVENDKGHFVEGLTRNDFEVRSDGAARPIEHFGVNTPVSILVVIDRSTSFSRELSGSKALGDTISWLAKQAQPASPIRVGGLTRRLNLMPTFVVDRPSLLAGAQHVVAMPDAERIGPTPIVDAIDAAVRVLAETTGRRALVLLTDGRSAGNYLSAADVQRQVTVAGVAVSIVLVPNAGAETIRRFFPQAERVAAAMHPAALLRPIVDASGGAMLTVKEPVAPEPVHSLERIFTRLRRTYTLGIIPAGDGRFHQLAVHVNRPGVRVAARAGYQSR